MNRLRIASITVHATAAQSARWKQAAEAEGFHSAGAWLACAADAYLKARARAGAPVPLAWRRGTFKATLGGRELVKFHRSIRMTPAMKAGVALNPWSVAELAAAAMGAS